jgi:uncharacterized protein (DUF1684 family)
VWISSVLAVAFAIGLWPSGGASYQAEIEQWRRGREAALRADDGWLTVVGLFWLTEGKNSVGTDPASAIVLPPGSAPGIVGEFDFSNGAATFHAAPGVKVTINDHPPTTATLRPDTDGMPDLVRINDLTLMVLQRGSRYGIRLKDGNSEMRRTFAGLKYFSVKDGYRVTAKFHPYNPPKAIPIPNILGDTEEEQSPGYVRFTVNGQMCRLDAIREGESLFFIFKDKTSGRETYPAGRFLYTDLPKNGEVILDLNKAYNPPCAFTPFATCPLPPQQNVLSVRIEAGELRYGH